MPLLGMRVAFGILLLFLPFPYRWHNLDLRVFVKCPHFILYMSPFQGNVASDPGRQDGPSSITAIGEKFDRVSIPTHIARGKTQFDQNIF